MTTTFALVFVMIGLPQAASAADCPTEIKAEDCGCEISSPGQYRLVEDCPLAPNETGIRISASNVFLNLHGRTISGPGCFGAPGEAGLDTFGITVSGSDVHITNGTAKALTTGIQVAGNHNHLSHLTLEGNCTGGLKLVDANDTHVNGSNISANIGDGMVFLRANHNVIDSNVINDNGFGRGITDPGARGGGLILLDGSDDNTITSNKLFRNNTHGVRVGERSDANSNHNTIRGNIVKDTSNIGIVVNPNSNNNTIQSNRVTGNETGIGLFDAIENFVYRNKALENGGEDEDNRKDLVDTNCNNNTWTNNIFVTDNEGDGPRMGCIQ